MNKPPSKRIRELDALRGLAAVAVVLYHYTHGYEKLLKFTQPAPPDFRFGFLGVQLFFIISGFVIFMTVERTEKPLDFVWARLTRLYPTFWAGVLVTVVGVSFSILPNSYRRTPFEILTNLTMLHEFFEIRPVDGVYWTLTRELIFYVIIFVVMAFGLLRHTTALSFAWLTVQLAANLIERFHGSFPYRIRFYLLTEFCHLFIAGIVFYRIFTGKVDKLCYALLGFCLLNHFLLVDNPGFPASRVEEGIFVALFFLLFWIVATGKAPFLAWKPLIFLGSISYAMYLVHQVLGYAIIRWFDLQGQSCWVGIAVASVFSIVAATLITWYVEKPAIKFLRTVYSPARPKS